MRRARDPRQPHQHRIYENERSRTPAPASPRTADASASLLALQRTAGNSAVARLVEHSESPSDSADVGLVQRVLELDPAWDTGYGWANVGKLFSSWPKTVAALRARFAELERIHASVADAQLTDRSSDAYRKRDRLGAIIATYGNPQAKTPFSKGVYRALADLLDRAETYAPQLSQLVTSQRAEEVRLRKQEEERLRKEAAEKAASEQASDSPTAGASLEVENLLNEPSIEASSEVEVSPEQIVTAEIDEVSAENLPSNNNPLPAESLVVPEPQPPTPLEKATADIDEWLTEQDATLAVTVGERAQLIQMEQQIYLLEAEKTAVSGNGRKAKQTRRSKSTQINAVIDAQAKLVDAAKARFQAALDAAERPVLDAGITVSRWDKVPADAPRPAYQRPGVFQVRIGNEVVQMGLNKGPVTKHLSEFLLRRIHEGSHAPQTDVGNYVNSLCAAVVSLGESAVKQLAGSEATTTVNRWELIFQYQNHSVVCHHAVPKGGGANPYWTPKGYKGGPV